MKDASDVIACVCDHRGLFLPVAHRLSEGFKKVYHWSAYEEGFSSIRKGVIGDGFPNIEWCRDPWDIKGQVDLFVFPDVELSGMQLELESQGYAVWGPRRADTIELNREKFLKILKDVGLDVPQYEVFTGLSALHEHLRDCEDCYIKISRWRGDMETTHWRSWKQDEGFLDYLAVRFGPAKEFIRFLVFDPIDADIELGGDTYCIDGNWPKLMLNGTEWKDKAYLGVVTDTKDMPRQVLEVMAAFAPEFEKERYRCEFSSEIRIQGDKAYFIDPTCRGGLPSTGSQLKLWGNFPEIVWAGAHGVLVEPEPLGMYSAECVLKTKVPPGNWAVVELTEALKPWAMLANCCLIDGAYAFPPDDQHGEEIGWLVAIGDTPQATIESMREKVEMLPEGVSAEFISLADILKEMDTAEEHGVQMSDDALPEPSTVIES